MHIYSVRTEITTVKKMQMYRRQDNHKRLARLLVYKLKGEDLIPHLGCSLSRQQTPFIAEYGYDSSVSIPALSSGRKSSITSKVVERISAVH